MMNILFPVKYLKRTKVFCAQEQWTTRPCVSVCVCVAYIYTYLGLYPMLQHVFLCSGQSVVTTTSYPAINCRLASPVGNKNCSASAPVFLPPTVPYLSLNRYTRIKIMNSKLALYLRKFRGDNDNITTMEVIRGVKTCVNAASSSRFQKHWPILALRRSRSVTQYIKLTNDKLAKRNTMG
jgi:hypothetical protein